MPLAYYTSSNSLAALLLTGILNKKKTALKAEHFKTLCRLIKVYHINDTTMELAPQPTFIDNYSTIIFLLIIIPTAFFLFKGLGKKEVEKVRVRSEERK